jgi:hypothetical protein
MEERGVAWCLLCWMEMSGQLNVPPTLPPQKDPAASLGYEAQWVVVSLPAVEKRKFSNPCQELNLDSSVIKSIP